MKLKIFKRNRKESIPYSILKYFSLILTAIVLIFNYRVVFAITTNMYRDISGYSKEYKLAKSQFEKGLKNEQYTIVLNNVNSSSTAKRVVYEFFSGNPEYFYISKVSYKKTNINQYTYYITYMEKGFKLQEIVNDYNDRIKSIASSMNKKASDYEKVVQIKNYIVDNFEYDYSLAIHDPYTMLLKNIGVCTAYSQLFKSLCDEMNLDCKIVLSNYDKHDWNIVKINGAWYHADITFTDTGKQNKYFLVPDSVIYGEGHHFWSVNGGYKIACFSYKYVI